MTDPENDPSTNPAADNDTSELEQAQEDAAHEREEEGGYQ